MGLTLDMYRTLLDKYATTLSDATSLRAKLARVEDECDSVKSQLIHTRDELNRANALIADLRADLPVAAKAAAAASGSPPGDTVDVLIASVGLNNKIQCIKAIREATGCGLKEAKDIVESHEKVVATGVTREKADRIHFILSRAGVAPVIISPTTPQPAPESATPASDQ